MNRSERRKQERFLKKNNKQKGQPLDHLHSHYSENDFSNMKEKIKYFLKTYDFKGSVYEQSYEYEKGVREIRQIMGDAFTIRLIDDVDESIMTLETNYPIVVDPNTKQIIKTDIFLIKEKNGWFIKYDKLGFSQNLIISVMEMGFENLMNNDLNAGGKIHGYLIPCMNNLIRNAFDRLSLRYGSEWVA